MPRAAALKRFAASAAALAMAPALSAANHAASAPPDALKGASPMGSVDWSNSGRIGAFVSDVSTEDSQGSRDSAIANSTGSTAWLLTFDDTFLWRKSGRSSDQNLILRYGRIREAGQQWVHNNDQIHLDGIFRREFAKPNFLCASAAFDSVFRNVVDHNSFDPVTVAVSAGFGQIWRSLLLRGDPMKNGAGEDRLEWHLGVRVQKRWSQLDVPAQDRVQCGPEGFLRYDRPVDTHLRWFVQYQVCTDFDDIHHLQQLVIAGMTAALARHVTAEIGFRAYRERQPRSVPDGLTGYDQWGAREDGLVGLTIAY